ncbi:MAG: hypothetical protein GC166_03050 [Alphaproteobacteria bacterium]|nr:hypothetical protein [Alphaproteobacteria bacterium]
MPVPGFAQGIQMSFLDTATHARLKAKAEAAAKTDPVKTADAAKPADAKTAATDDGFSFGDFLDIVNPLQHLPVVSTIYRELTGDQIKPMEKVAGGTLYGGVLGLASSLADVAFEKITGKDFGSTVMAMFEGDSEEPANVADNTSRVSKVADAKPAEAPAKVAIADVPQPVAMPTDLNVDALLAATKRNGLDAELAARAAEAYRKTVALQPQP